MKARAEKMKDAIADGNIKAVRMSIEKGYPINEKSIRKEIDMDGKTYSFFTTPMEFALDQKQYDIVKLLIDSGAEMPCRDSPLIRAIRHNRPDLFGYMVEHGADLSIANRYGERPYTAARKNRNTEMAEYIKNREPEELHSEAAQAERFAAYHVPKAMEEYLKTGNLRLEFSKENHLSWIKLYSYMDVVEMTYKNKKVLSLVEDSDDGDIILVWEPKSQKVCFVDTEEDTMRRVGTWEEFISAPEERLDRVIVWAAPYYTDGR